MNGWMILMWLAFAWLVFSLACHLVDGADD